MFVGATDPRLFELGGRLAEQLQEQAGADRRRRSRPFRGPTREIENYYRAADLVVMPSLREGLPVVVLEAMACGLPVVASRLPGSTDTVITDGVNGRLVEPGDIAGFADAIGERAARPGARGPDRRRRPPHRGRAVSHRARSPNNGWRPTTSCCAAARAVRAMTHRHDIICISSIDWDFIWQGHQEIMSRLAADGHRVLFIENTGVRQLRVQRHRPRPRPPAQLVARHQGFPRGAAQPVRATRRSCCRCRTRGSRGGSTGS